MRPSGPTKICKKHAKSADTGTKRRFFDAFVFNVLQAARAMKSVPNRHQGALVRKSVGGRSSPCPRTHLSCDEQDRDAEGREAVEDRRADLGLGNLAVEVP